jgi:DNA invertase Pin-like site-specific DNA recombinase
MQSQQPRVYSYKRFSTPEQLQGDSLRRQTSMAAAWAAARGLELDEQLTYEDLGVSAFRGRNVDHGQLGEFLRAIRDGLVAPGSILLVESLDRLSRQAARRALRALEDIVDAGVTVVSLDTNREYTAESLNGIDIVEFVLRATLAYDESVKKQARLRQAWIGKREHVLNEGGALTARGPGWLRLVDGPGDAGRQWQVIEDRAAVVRRIFELAAQGVGVDTIAETLNRDRVPTFGRGMMWRGNYVKKILMSPAVIGSFVPRTLTYDARGRRRRDPAGDPIDGYFPAVVDAAVWETVQAMRSRRAPTNRPQYQVSYLLAGLATCPLCGSTMAKVMKGSSKKAGRPKLACSKAKVGAGCKYHVVDLETVETALIGGLDRAAAEAPGPDENIAKQEERVENEIAGTEDYLDRLLDALKRAPDSQAIVDRVTEVEARLRELEEQRGELWRQQLLADRRGYLKRQAVAVETIRAVPLDKVKANAALRAAVKQILVDYEDGTLDVYWLGDGVSSIRYRIDWGDGVVSFPYAR